MSWRSVLALLVLAFVGGAAVFAWINSDGRMFWEEPKAPIAAALEEAETASATNAIALPVIVQPTASQAEAMLLVLQARRAVEAGKPLGDLATRLQLTFGQAQPQAISAIVGSKRQQISNTALLKGFDAVAPRLAEPTGTTWDRARYELAHLFVIRRGEARPTVLTASIAKARAAISAGDIEYAAKTVRALPGPERAKDWLAQADGAIAVRKALDSLNQSAMLPPPVPVPATTVVPAPEATPAAPDASQN
jgi:hypothetical protein